MNALIFVSGIIGLAVGSFLNVVIYRSDPAFSETRGRAAPTLVGASLASQRRGRFRFGGPPRSEGAGEARPKYFLGGPPNPFFEGGEKGEARPKYFLGGRSFCPLCRKPLRWFELIPLVSFAIQKRKCRGCGELISWQYPLVEFGTATVFALIAWQYVGGALNF